MANDIPAVRERLQTLLLTIQGTKSAFAYAPRSVQEAHCPAWLIFPGPSEHEFNTNHDVMVTRLWRLMLFVGLVGTAAYGDLEKALEPFFERTEDLFASKLMLGELDPELQEALIVDDSGPGETTYPTGSDTRWFGSEWTLAVVTKRSVTTGR